MERRPFGTCSAKHPSISGNAAPFFHRRSWKATEKKFAHSKRSQPLARYPSPVGNNHLSWRQSLLLVPELRLPPFWYAPSPSTSGLESRLGLTNVLQGRAGLVAWRRSRGGVGALGNAFYKGGFETKMNKKEASLILALK